MDRTATVTAKGQVTIPAALRARLGVGPGDRLRFREDADGRVTVEKDARSFEDLRGIVKLDRQVSGADIDRWIAERRGRAEEGS